MDYKGNERRKLTESGVFFFFDMRNKEDLIEEGGRFLLIERLYLCAQ
jgi:hypothetical protein